MATINGTTGNDIINSTTTNVSGNDIITDLGGSDTIDASTGDDRIVLQRGQNTSTVVVGGAGIDTLEVTYKNTYADAITWQVVGTNIVMNTDTNLSALAQNLSSYSTFNVGSYWGGKVQFDKSIENLSMIAGSGNANDLLVVRGVGTYDGKEGTDVIFADFSTATNNIVIDNTNAALVNSFNGSTIQNIERLKLITGSGSDVIKAGNLNDELMTGAGHDQISDLGGSDNIDAGAGNDTISLQRYQNSSTVVEGGDGIDTLNVSYNNTYADAITWQAVGTTTTLSADSSLSSISQALSANSSFNVGSYWGGKVQFDNSIENLSITAGSGSANDLLIVRGVGHYDGKEGSDVLYVNFSAATNNITLDNSNSAQLTSFNGSTMQNIERLKLITGSGSDVIKSGALNDELMTGAGNDQIRDAGGNDQIDAGAGNDTITLQRYQNSATVVSGGAGIDTLNITYNNTYADAITWQSVGGSGAIALTAASSLSTIDAAVSQYSSFNVGSYWGGKVQFDNSIENLSMTAGAGSANDLLMVRGAGTYDGKEGTDVLFANYSSATNNISVDNRDASLANAMNGSTIQNIERLKLMTGSGSDTIKTGKLDDELVTGAGNDQITDLGGNDKIDAGDGNDTINLQRYQNSSTVVSGGAGVDSLNIVYNNTYADAITWQSVGGTGGVVLNANNSLSDIQQALSQYSSFNAGSYWGGKVQFDNSIENLSITAGSGNANDLLLARGVGNYDGKEGIDVVYADFSAATNNINIDNSNTALANSFNGSTIQNIERLKVITGSGSDVIKAAGYDDEIIAGAGNDMIDGGAGADKMAGGSGNDTYYVDNAHDAVTENLNEGTDTVNSSITYTLGANVENLTLTGTAAINGTGNDADNVITGNAAANVLTGGRGHDRYVVSTGDTVVEQANEGTDTVSTDISYTLGANLENLVLTGTAAINGTGNELNNVLVGNSAANVLSGGAGNDTYVVGAGDTVVENANEGIDTVQSSVSYSLGANLENLTLIGTAAINGTGNELNNVLVGNSAANVLSGGAGNDTYVIGAGDTVIENANEGIDTVQSTASYTLGANIENLTLIGSAAINGTGNALNNILVGNSAANVLAGGAGNDTYVIGIGDTVVEALNAGVDTVQANFSYTLSANVENLTLTGSAAINGTGNALNNVLVGNAANNILSGGAGNDMLNGGAGADRLVGGTGNDTYYVDNVGDTVVEALSEGIDKIISSVSYSLGANVENLSLIGSANINATGNALNNVLVGNDGANVLTGGAGNDTYVVSTGDTVIELAGGGSSDQVQADISYTLGANLEHLVLTGIGNINGTGNELNNVIRGNSGNNILDGGLGSDVLKGGLGDDTYIVGTGDLVTEIANQGNDTVIANINYTLGANLENLTLSGNAAINGTGNELNNTLTAGAGANVLTGGLGVDTFVWHLADVPTGSHADKVADFNSGETLDLRDLVSNGASLVIDNSTHTITAKFNDAGGSAHTQVIQVNFDAGLIGSHDLHDVGGGVIKIG